ncbi:MAG: hypothetical protein U9R42_08850 [Bacteroidota bacterium]|nr:hypothetical protein [Bacteroidota bacterium]
MRTQNETAKASNTSSTNYKYFLKKYTDLLYPGVPKFMVFGKGAGVNYPSLETLKQKIKEHKEKNNH